MEVVLLFITAFVASVVAAIVGFGGGVILLPVLVAVCGVREAVPVLVITQLVGNFSRVVLYRREIDFPVVGWFSLGAVPLGLGGGLLFATAPLPVLTKVIGIALIVLVAGKRLPSQRTRANRKTISTNSPVHFPEGEVMTVSSNASAELTSIESCAESRARWFMPQSQRAFVWFGAVSSFLGAIVGTVGPLTVAFFAAFGLTRGALVGTEACCALVMHVAKLTAYGSTSVLDREAITLGATLTPAVIAGSLVGKRFVDRLPRTFFSNLIDAALVLGAVLLLTKS